MTPLTDHPERFERVGACVVWDAARDRREPRRITGVRRLGDALLLRFAGCETAEAAKEYRLSWLQRFRELVGEDVYWGSAPLPPTVPLWRFGYAN